ncbi:hypothetical protein [Rugamonas sp.]|uniref:hypothetical protein n=1 Tax=Rugamonas sp. TaxID=1926287 RepID=UPI0025E8CEC7|nr:hypothetical protein [Rugamonas sp.]
MSQSTFLPAINFAIAALTAIYADPVDVAQGNAGAPGACDADVSPACPSGIPLRWICDNLGCHDRAVFVSAMSEDAEVEMPLEEALRRIDDFYGYGRRRILSGLAMHFGFDVQTYAQRGAV